MKYDRTMRMLSVCPCLYVDVLKDRKGKTETWRKEPQHRALGGKGGHANRERSVKDLVSSCGCGDES